MAVETMSVVGTRSGKLSVNARQNAHCDRCVASAGCGMKLLGSAFDGKHDILEFPMPDHLKGKLAPGDSVDIAIIDSQLFSLALLHYMTPLSVLLGATFLADKIMSAIGLSEIWVIVSALAALLCGMTFVRFQSVKPDTVPLEITASAGRREY